MEKYVGLFFGSFNPIHNGHLAIARYLLQQGYCAQVWFIVSPCNPWKKDQELLDERCRLQMVRKAIQDDRRMRASDIEFSMPRPSYTYQTLQALQVRYPRRHFQLIIGGDNLSRFHDWRNYAEILASFPLLVYPRPGIKLPEHLPPSVTVADAPLTTVSSTEIREKLRRGEDISALVPAAILPLVQKYYHSTDSRF